MLLTDQPAAKILRIIGVFFRHQAAPKSLTEMGSRVKEFSYECENSMECPDTRKVRIRYLYCRLSDLDVYTPRKVCL